MSKQIVFLSFISSLLVGVFFVNQAQAAVRLHLEPEVKRFNRSFEQVESFMAFTEDFQGGASVAYGDIDGNGSDEVIVGAGPGGGPNVKVFTSSGEKLLSFFPYVEEFKKGVYVASCDVNSDDLDEIITSPRFGGGPNVKVYNGQGENLSSFMAYEERFHGGVSIACGDVTGDGIGDIVTGSGYDSGNQVRIFNMQGEYLGLDFWPFASYERGGVSVATANVDGEGADEIIMGVQRFGHGWIKVYKAESERPILAEFIGFPLTYKGGINVAGADLDGDGKDEVLAAANGNGGPDVRAFWIDSTYFGHFFPYPENFRGGVFIATGDPDGDGVDDILTGPGRLTAHSPDDIGKYILVDLSEQRLYAYHDGVLRNTFLVSTGVAKYPTPMGEFSVFRKVPVMDYEWTYGPEHPDNYDIENVSWNLNFTPHYYLHTAYWHNNFGYRMSHGCVNIAETNAKWLYDWGELGTRVNVRE